MEAADDDYWSRLSADQAPSVDAYQKALARSRSPGLSYLPADSLAADLPTDELLRRIGLDVGSADRASFDAALGTAGTPALGLSGGVRVIAHQDCDVQLRRPQSFAAMLDALA